MADQKIFLRCSAKQRSFQNGGSVINLSVKVDELIAFATAHRNQGGYLNLTVAELRAPGKYGDTHSVALDTFVPKARVATREPGSDDEDIAF